MAECFIYLKTGFSLVADASSVVSIILLNYIADWVVVHSETCCSGARQFTVPCYVQQQATLVLVSRASQMQLCSHARDAAYLRNLTGRPGHRLLASAENLLGASFTVV